MQSLVRGTSLRSIALELDSTPGPVAIAWVRVQPWRAIPILGARIESQLRENLGGLRLELGDEYLERLNALL